MRRLLESKPLQTSLPVAVVAIDSDSTAPNEGRYTLAMHLQVEVIGRLSKNDVNDSEKVFASRFCDL